LLAGLGAWAGLAAAPEALDAVPADSFAVISVDVGAFQGSPLAQLAPRAAELVERALLPRPSSGKAAQPQRGVDWPRCAAAALGLRSIAVSVPETPGDFGVAADGAFGEEARACVAWGGAARATSDPRYPGFVLFRDEARPKGAWVAARARGPVLVAPPEELDRMMRTVRGEGPSVRTNAAHRELRAALGDAALVATVTLSRAFREKVRSEVGGEGEATTTNAVDAILDVSSAGLAIDVRPDVRVHLELACEHEAACDRIRAFLERRRFLLSQNLGVRLAGFGPFLDRFQAFVTPTGKLVASTDGPTEPFVGALEGVTSKTQGKTNADAGQPEPP
jgi:hypothetical protein